jgi:hypothetical protein
MSMDVSGLLGLRLSAQNKGDLVLDPFPEEASENSSKLQ